jgi:hypothetical protein
MKFIFDSSQIFTVLSRRKAIRARCIDCSGFIKSEVRNCNHADCDLHPFRSGQGKQNPVERDKSIRKYCLQCMNGKRNVVMKCPSIDCSLYTYRLTQKTLNKSSNLPYRRPPRTKKHQGIPLPHTKQKTDEPVNNLEIGYGT